MDVHHFSLRVVGYGGKAHKCPGVLARRFDRYYADNVILECQHRMVGRL